MALAVGAGLLSGQQSEVTFLRLINAWDWQGAMAAITGVPDRVFFSQHTWPDPAQVVAVMGGLRARRWSAFAWLAAAWVGQPGGRFTVKAQRCSGKLDASAPAAGGGSLARGWLAGKPVPSWTARIVLADMSGTITRLAHGGVLDFGPADETKSFFSGWIGYVRDFLRSAGPLTAYLVLPGNQACQPGPA